MSLTPAPGQFYGTGRGAKIPDASRTQVTTLCRVAEPNEEKETQADESEASSRALARTSKKARSSKAEEAQDARASEGDEGDEAEGADEAQAEGDKEEGDEEQEAPKPNRRERRRRKKVSDEDAVLRDRNARVRAQLTKKKDEQEESLDPLTTGEMIDDVLARSTARAGKWAKQNAGFLQVLVLALFVGGIGYGGYSWYATSQAEQASADLTTGLQADRGRVDAVGPVKQDGEEELYPVFKTPAARADAALAGYRKAQASRGSGTAILARLGEAGVLLDKRAYDEALAAYREVKASPLAAADPDVRGRAIEGIGFALEAKGDSEGALKVYRELDTITGLKGLKELGMYHQARLLTAKGEKEQASKLIKDARERLQTSGESKNFSYLLGVLDELTKQIDPTAATKKAAGGLNRKLTEDEVLKLMQKAAQPQPKDDHH